MSKHIARSFLLRSFQHSCSSASSLSFRPRKNDRRRPSRRAGLIQPPGPTEKCPREDDVVTIERTRTSSSTSVRRRCAV